MEKLNEKNLEYIVGGYENDMPNSKAASTTRITESEPIENENDNELDFYYSSHEDI